MDIDKNLIEIECKTYNNAQCTIYVNHPKKTLKWKNFHKAKEDCPIESTQIRWFLGQSDGRLYLVRGGQWCSKTKRVKGGTHIRWFS
jgi:hypothetical protein